MSKIATGGPAFSSEYTGHEGMSLRDWFAGQAIGDVIKACAGDAYQIATYPTPEAYFAAKAYAVADAMVAESAKAKKVNDEARKEEWGNDLPF